MNFRLVPERWQCTRCGETQAAGNNYCRACGVSFVFGLEDAEWSKQTFVVESKGKASSLVDMVIDAVSKWMKAD